MDPNIKSEQGRPSSLNNNNCASSPTSSCGSPPANNNIAVPVKGLEVFVDSCLICNSQSYLCPKDNSVNENSRQRSIECRSAFYSLFDIPVPDDDFFFIRRSSQELPFCSGCTFKLGRLKMLHEQLEALQKEFGKMKEEIAFSIVDVVAGSGVTDAEWGPSLPLRSLPDLTLQRYLETAEVDTLQRFVFDEWHDKSYSEASEEDSWSSPSPQPVQVVNKPPPTTPTNHHLGPKLFGSSSTSSSESSTGNISMATPETRVAKRGNHSTPREAGKRNAEGPSAGIGNVPKKLKWFPGINETDLRGAETYSVVGRRADEVVRGSPPMKLDEEGGGGIEIIILDEGDDDQTEEKYDPTDSVEMSMVDSGDSKESNASPQDGRRTFQGTDIHGRDSSTSSGNNGEETIDFYEGMSLAELANFVTEEDGEDMAEEGQDGGGDEEVDDDPERQEYFENVIAQLQQAGGSNFIEFQVNEEGLYVCMFCNKTFIHKYPFRDHLKTHTGEGPRCPVCNKIFPKNHNLVLHLRTHTGEKPFQCDVCQKGFADKSNLKVHYRVHTGERPYKCDLCNLAFVNSSRLAVHRRLHTGDQRPFVCEVCGRNFASSSQLQSHEKIHKASGTSSD